MMDQGPVRTGLQNCPSLGTMEKINYKDDSRNTTAITSKVIKKDKNPSRSTNQKRKNRLGKDGPHPKEERILALKMDRYAKLLHQAEKQLTKQVKQVRSFLLQRQIRKMKSTCSRDEAIDDLHQQRDHHALQPLKDLSQDLVVQQAMRQLGLIHANPNPDADINGQVPPLDRSSLTYRLVSKILDHKRFQAALEEWNEKVAEFRRFCLHLDDKNDPFLDAEAPMQRKKKKGQSNSPTTTSLLPQTTSKKQNQPTSFFCSSLNDVIAQPVTNNEGSTTMMAYGPAATLDHSGHDINLIKKNRRGQRARKAKALAIQAKKAGKKQEYYQSLNWREDKESRKQRQPENVGGERNRKAKNSTETRSALVPPTTFATADLSKNHPSWAAKQQQKPMIVSFQGTKIKFD